MKRIKLTKGKFALVDDDCGWLTQYKWYFNELGYAWTRINGKAIYMHRLIINTPVGKDTDHINRDGLDNRRINLRIRTRQENSFNSIARNGISGAKGVYPANYGNKWVARIKINYKLLYLGTFETKKEAVEARKITERKLFGEFTRA